MRESPNTAGKPAPIGTRAANRKYKQGELHHPGVEDDVTLTNDENKKALSHLLLDHWSTRYDGRHPPKVCYFRRGWSSLQDRMQCSSDV